MMWTQDQLEMSPTTLQLTHRYLREYISVFRTILGDFSQHTLLLQHGKMFLRGAVAYRYSVGQFSIAATSTHIYYIA